MTKLTLTREIENAIFDEIAERLDAVPEFLVTSRSVSSREGLGGVAILRSFVGYPSSNAGQLKEFFSSAQYAADIERIRIPMVFATCDSRWSATQTVPREEPDDLTIRVYSGYAPLIHPALRYRPYMEWENPVNKTTYSVNMYQFMQNAKPANGHNSRIVDLCVFDIDLLSEWIESLSKPFLRQSSIKRKEK